MRRLLPLAVSLALAQAAAASGNEAPPAFEPAIVELRVNEQDDGPTLVVRRDARRRAAAARRGPCRSSGSARRRAG
jgi:hypothetical protein